MTKAPELGKSELVPTAGHCMECGQLYSDVYSDECPEDAGHVLEPIHVSQTPLGFDDDKDYYHFGRNQYEYTAKEWD